MLEACRTCLRLIDLDNLPFYEIESDDVQLSSESTRLKLLSFIPEMVLDITPKSMLCAKCHKSLEAVFKFKTECLQTEEIIMHYLKTKLHFNNKNLDLKDVSAFNAADINIIGNETVKLPAEDDVEKEEMEVYNSVITNLKEEVDDFLLEISNVVQSMTDVPCSLNDTRISEEEAVEALIGDDAVKDEIEACDTVIANLKDETDDFFSESVEVAQLTMVVPHPLTDIRIGEEVAVRASVEDDTVKNEIEVCDTVIANLKDKGQDFLSESVEVAQLTIIMANSSPDVRIGKDNPGEDDTLDDKMEVCDTVVTNLTDKVDDFSSKSVKVARPKNTVPRSNFTCKYCNKCCKNSSLLKVHLRTHTGEKPYRCETCECSFTQRTSLTRHLSRHTSERPYICTVCCKGFSTNSKLTMHMPIHTGEKPYRCETCKCSFTNKTNLTRHLRVHTGKRLYICTFCDEGFSENNSLTEHMRIHIGERPYHCEICNCSFTNRTNLTRHLRIHTGERPYACTLCNKGFIQKYSLTGHMRIHTGERPYHCEICDGRFQQKTHLKKHIRTHSGERPYACTTCGKAYTSKFILNKHKCTSNIEQLLK